MLHVVEHIAGRDLIRRAVFQVIAYPLSKLLQRALIGNQRERAQAAGNAVRSNVELDPECPLHDCTPSGRVRTAASVLAGSTCR